MTTPFVVGQTLRDVLYVTEHTGRVLKSVVFKEVKGTTITIQVDRKTDIRRELGIMGIDVNQIFWSIRRVYQDCELLFRYIDGAYRVTEIVER